MSIIIRLQNLPLSAKSGDIRRFFGGLRIPNGGVHIVGGEKGDAFIAFTSDEDARIAMRKDGHKILDTRVKLYLSSRMEMQHEIGRVTVKDQDSPRQRSPNGRQRSSRSPFNEPDEDYDRSYRSNSLNRGRRDYSPRLRRSPDRRSRSPRRRSRSPRRWSRSPSGPRRSRSPTQRTVTSSESTYKLDENLLKLEKIFGIDRASSDDSSWKSKEFRREEQALLEQKIAEALTASLSNMGKMTDLFHSPKQAEPPMNMQMGRNSQQFTPAEPNMMPYNPEYNNLMTIREMPIQDNRMFMPNVMPNMNMPGNYPPGGVPSYQHPVSMPPPTGMPPPMMHPVQQHPVSMPPPMTMPSVLPPAPIQTMPPPMPYAQPPPAVLPQMNAPNNLVNHNIPLVGFFVTISGLNPSWNLTDIQTMLKGAFVPQKSIMLEKNDTGASTGTAFIKLYNKDDFLQLTSHATYTYNNRLISVTDCPDFLAQRYFNPEMPTEGSLCSSKGCFYYKLAGLPYEACFELVLHFFEDLEVLDLYIVYSKATNGFRIQGKATGIAFIAFGNEADAQKALTKNLTNFLNTRRIVKLVSCTKRNMLEAKKINNDLLSQSNMLIPRKASDNRSGPNAESFEKRPLCMLLTGLPQNINIHKIIGFFKPKANPGYIHMLLNNQKKPNGRAFVEFDSLQDFDAACKCHGNKMDDKVICVKQILFEEMTKSLESQRGHVYSHPPKNANKSSCFPEDENYPQYNSPRKNFQVFEYGNESRKADPVDKMEASFSNKRKQGPRPNLAFPDRDPSFNSQQVNNRKKLKEEEERKRQLEERKRKEEEERKMEQKKKRENEEKRKREEEERKKREMELRKKKEEEERRKREEEERRKWELEEAARIPVKFEVKIKPAISKNVKMEDAFDSSSKADPKRKLSKLSPERPPAVPPVKKSNENKEPPKAKSPAKDTKKSDKTDSHSSTINRDSKKPRNRSPDRSNGRRIVERSPTRSNSRRSPIRRRISRSPQRRVEYNKPYSFNEDFNKETVVQMTNVDPVIGSAELLDFFYEFVIDPDKIVRRLGERGEPTGDVRVTFQSRRDANRAIRTLSHSYMHGLPIDMFIV